MGQREIASTEMESGVTLGNSLKQCAVNIFKPIIKISSIADVADLFALLAIVVVVMVSIARQSFFIFYEHIMTASVASYILAYLVTSYALKKHGVGNRRIFYSIAAMASATFLYEMLFHYFFPGTLSVSKLINDFKHVSFNTSVSGDYFPIVWGLIVVSTIFTGIEYMRFNKWNVLFLGSHWLPSVGSPRKVSFLYYFTSDTFDTRTV
jgi:hypothetical protein